MIVFSPEYYNKILSQALDSLQAEGIPITVRALTRRAGVRTQIASDWLKEYRQNQQEEQAKVQPDLIAFSRLQADIQKQIRVTSAVLDEAGAVLEAVRVSKKDVIEPFIAGMDSITTSIEMQARALEKLNREERFLLREIYRAVSEQ